MSLTVPTSGNIGGASASVQIATPDTGAVISEFGNKMAEIGFKYKAEQTDYQTRQAQMGMTNDLANARLEAEQVGDPVASGQIWDTRKAEIYSKYLPTDANGKSILDQKQQQDLQLAFTDLDGKHTFALSEKAVNWTRQTASANWLKSRDEITTKATTADPETFGALLQLGEAEINAQEKQGLMDPATAEANRQALRQDVYKGRADAQINADPQGFLAAADKGEFDGLGGDLLTSRRASATNEIARRQAEDDKAAALSVKQRDDALKSRFGEITNVAKAGASAVDEDYLNSPEVKAAIDANPELAKSFGEAKAAIALRGELPGIHQMSPSQLSAEIAKEKANPVTHEYQTERLKVLQGWHDQAVAKWNTDKVATAKEVGMPVPELGTFDPADPKSFAQGIAGRLSFDSTMKTQDYGAGQGILSNDEKAQLKPVLAPEADANTKLALAVAVAAGAKGQPDTVAKAMGADDTFLRATRILTTTGDQNLAGSILRGQQKIATKTVAMPTEKTMMLTFDDITGGIYNDNPTMKAEVMNAARALYADGAGGLDPDQGPGGVSVMGVGWSTDPASVSLFTEAVKRVSGATADAKGDLTIGGVQPINGAFVSLPPGIGVDHVSASLDELGAQLRGKRAGADPLTDMTGVGAAPAADPLRSFKAVSLYGGVPDLGPNPIDRLDTLTLQRVKGKNGQDTDFYQFAYEDGGNLYTIKQTDGIDYRFKLSDLLRETGQ